MCVQVHKETVSKVPNAVSGKDNIDLEIFGMEGIPEGDRIAHELALQGESLSLFSLPMSAPARLWGQPIVFAHVYMYMYMYM